MERPDSSLKAQFKAIRPRYPELAGKVALVTGSSRGIGKGIALRLARERMKLVITGLDQVETETVARELGELEVEACAFWGDLSENGNINRLFDQSLAAYGRLDLLVNNAASLIKRSIFEAGEDLLEQQLASNIKNPYLCAYHAAKIMARQQEGGSIISISSVGGLQAHWKGLPYDVTKGALDSMTRAMALELADYGIRVNAIAPGAIWTEQRNGAPEEKTKAVAERIPLRRFGYPQDIASLIAFLTSPEGNYITGQIIYVDGGITAQLSPRNQPI
ncbi:MAG TPA: glucose 1-dehydrogenase [Chloroflexia bacterium]|nr:glucose 1-dehydrogenase [Chloroflexia bacterium]